MMEVAKIQSFSRVVPMIYAYNTPGVSYHEGWTKIGYTEKQTVTQRIKQQTHRRYPVSTGLAGQRHFQGRLRGIFHRPRFSRLSGIRRGAGTGTGDRVVPCGRPRIPPAFQRLCPAEAPRQRGKADLCPAERAAGSCLHDKSLF